MAEEPLSLLVYDASCRARGMGLSDAWYAGSLLYRARSRFDHCLGARSWDEALAWLAGIERQRPVERVQYWGHGRWGRVLLAGEALDIDWLAKSHPQAAPLDGLRDRLTDRASFWFRTCETFGARPGHTFAQAFSERLGCRAAGHTFIIAWWQSGLHSIEPGAAPTWPVDEGLLEGTPNDPTRA